MNSAMNDDLNQGNVPRPTVVAELDPGRARRAKGPFRCLGGLVAGNDLLSKPQFTVDMLIYARWTGVALGGISVDVLVSGTVHELCHAQGFYSEQRPAGEEP